ncbi:MAG: BON domain-containing protein [Terriglobales bacterium]
MRGTGRLAAGLILGLTLSLWGVAQARPNAHPDAMDQQIASYLRQEFAKKPDLAQLHVAAEDRVVTLAGTTPSYRAKLQALHSARQVESANGVIDEIKVGGPAVPDAQLQRQIAERLTYDRMGMGQTFNAIGVSVKGGVVVLTGNVRDYPDRDSAVDIVADTTGVKGLIDKIAVAPLSPSDDRIRTEAARRIYGNPSLLRYANNPAHTIRIVVENGRVTLEGAVTSQVDKALAGNAVRGIPGVFSVTNNLEVVR